MNYDLCIGKFQTTDGIVHLACPHQSAGVRLVSTPGVFPRIELSTVLHASHPQELLASLLRREGLEIVTEGAWVSPICSQEVWAAGVTYQRSSEARQQESKGASRFYDMVYSAARPELFFKATPERVVQHLGAVAIRTDSKWSVPEPELALVINPLGEIVGYTVGNDMSARDIEGENPLYLPQAKMYSKSCSLGPWICLGLPAVDCKIHLKITDSAGLVLFAAQTSWSQMRRSPTELSSWLFRENSFPSGVFLLTGTGIVPPDEFTLVGGEIVSITICGCGTLTNPVINGPGDRV